MPWEADASLGPSAGGAVPNAERYTMCPQAQGHDWLAVISMTPTDLVWLDGMQAFD